MMMARSTGRCSRLGQSEIMLNLGGHPSSSSRREFDLYTYVDDVNGLRRQLDGKAEIIEELHDTFYGMREFKRKRCSRIARFTYSPRCCKPRYRDWLD